MGEAHHRNKAAARTTSSRLGVLKGTIGGGEIVEVQGGHIVRSTGRKDRHSKVCTAKGPRDRRVRLSAPTAIQFYDVQDRLGYDRPSKAVDWLIKKAKPAIDKLAELPPWKPETLADHNTKKLERNTTKTDYGRAIEHQLHIQQMGSEVQNLHQHHHHHLQHQEIGDNPNDNGNNSSFLPTSLHSDSIADTIKSFFPTEASTETDSSSIQFHNYPPDLLSTTSSQNQDLRLSLHSFQEPMLLQHHHEQHQAQAHRSEHEQAMYSGVNPLGFDGGASTGWDQHHPVEIGRFQRMIAWNGGGDTGSGAGCGGGGGGGGGGGFIFNSPPPLAHPLQPLFGQNNQLFSQRGPLQSSYTPSIRAWVDQPITATHDHHQQQQQHYHHNIPQPIHPSYISGIGFASSSSGFSGYRIPARIQGDDEEEHDGIPNKLSSASSDSGH